MAGKCQEDGGGVEIINLPFPGFVPVVLHYAPEVFIKRDAGVL
jgi:hypothetical protein